MFSDPMANRVGSSNATPPSGAPGGPPGPGGPPSSIGGHQATQVPPTGLPPLGSSSSTSSASALLATATILGPGQQGFTFPPLPQPPPPSFTGPLSSSQLPPWLPGGQGQPGPMPYSTASGMPTASSKQPSGPLPMPGPGPFGPSSSSSSTAQGAPPPARQRFMAQGGDAGLPRWAPETPDARMMTAKGLTETKGKPPLFGQTLYKDVLAAKQS